MTLESIVVTKPRQYISSAGDVVQGLPEFAKNPRNLVPFYRAMLLTRAFDEKAVSLQRTGRLGTYPSSLGQEAVGVGVAAAMRETDVLLPSFREQSAMLWRGVSIEEILLYWGGDETGNNFSKARNDFPICVPVGTHFSHAAGVGFALKSTGKEDVAVAIAGDGATSKGDFYESINLAGIWQLPVIFVINNNQWAISVPRSKQSASKTLAHKAVAAGIPGLQVDGNDVVAVRQVVSEALEQARKKNQPCLIEAITYRLTDHTTADDASRYRDDAEVSEHWASEPIKRMRIYLEQHAGWSRIEEETLLNKISNKIETAANAYLESAPQSVESCFDHLYAELPDSLSSQRLAALTRSRSGA
jgi:pyruvate dehydrogenase E1 component alpha subunit